MQNEDAIRETALYCNECFDTCLAEVALRDHFVSLRSAQGDFSLWCSAIRATNVGKSSLDYRLRNHEDVRDVVSGLLGGLAVSLTRCLQSVSENDDRAENPVDVPRSPSSTDSPVSWDAISEDYSDPNSLPAHEPGDTNLSHSIDPILSECLSYIRTTLDQLARISLAIRKSGSSYRFEKADAALNEDEYESFRSHLTRIALRSFLDPQAEALSTEEKMRRASDYGRLTPVQKRLIHANILRRHRIDFITKSRASHKLPVIREDEMHERPLKGAESWGTSSKAGRETLTQAVEKPSSELQASPSTHKPVGPPTIVTTAPTATEVGSRLDAQQLIASHTPSKATNITRVGATQSYPGCPKPGLDQLLICPYCDDVLPSSYAKMEHSWKAHVGQDILPYSCFIDECSTPNKMYLTAENLLAHVMDDHSSMRWTCSLCTPSDDANATCDFSSVEAWTQHVQETHGHQIKPERLNVFAELNKRLVIGPLSCPLCDFSTGGLASRIDDHILHHLHEFSLWALPDRADAGVDDERNSTSRVSSFISYTKAIDSKDRFPLEYWILTRGEWYADWDKLLSLLPRIMQSRLDLKRLGFESKLETIDSNVEFAEFAGCHMRKFHDAVEMMAEQHESVAITEEMLQSIIDPVLTDLHELFDEALVWPREGEVTLEKEDIAGLHFFLPERDPHFTERDDILVDIDLYLFHQQSALRLDSDHSQPKHQPRVVLTGNASTGKTAIAVELAHQIKDERHACSVFWIDATGMDTVNRAYENLWAAIGKPVTLEYSVHSLIYYLNWRIRGQWLMILDGIEAQTLHDMQLKGWLPNGLGGRLLITTRDAPSCLSLLGQTKEFPISHPSQNDLLSFGPPLRPADNQDIDVVIICTLPAVYDAIRLLMDNIWDEPSGTKKNKLYQNDIEDSKTYLTGSIGSSNVVVIDGDCSDSIDACRVVFKWPGIQLMLVVGTGTILSPTPTKDETAPVFRGDVLVSRKTRSERVHPLLETTRESLQKLKKSTAFFLGQLKAKFSYVSADYYAYPGEAEDRLFMSEYHHQHRGSPTCECKDSTPVKGRYCTAALVSTCAELECDIRKSATRERPQTRSTELNIRRSEKAHQPSVHFGSIAIANKPSFCAEANYVDKKPENKPEKLYSQALARLIQEYLVFPQIVINGVSGYGDFHNDIKWLRYAAATAASAARAILVEYNRLPPCMVPLSLSLDPRREEMAIHLLDSVTPGVLKGSSNRRKVLVGSGGPEIAAQAAFMLWHLHKIPVLWISATTSDSFSTGLRRIGHRLRIHDFSLYGDTDAPSIIRGVLEDRFDDWLLIIESDNGDSIGLHGRLLTIFGGSILFVSPNNMLSPMIPISPEDVIMVPSMDITDPVPLFGHYFFDEIQPLDNEKAIRTLAEKLGYKHADKLFALPTSDRLKVEDFKKQGPGPDEIPRAELPPVFESTNSSPDTTALHTDNENKREAEEDVWGYLIPVPENSRHAIVLRRRAVATTEIDKEHPGFRKAEKKSVTGVVQHNKQASPVGYLIGRHPKCDIVVDKPTVSNRHCIVFFEVKQQDIVAVLEDFSSNGTFVNGAIVGQNSRRELQDGEEISVLDEARFIFRYSSFRVSETFSQKYTILDQIGKGYYGHVHHCTKKSTGHRYAVKVYQTSQEAVDVAKQEIAILMGIRHPNIVELKEAFHENGISYLVTELVSGGELFDLIVTRRKLTESETRKVFSQLFQAVKYLHDKYVIHRNIKPETIMVDGDWNFKLGDFGMSKVVGDRDFTTTLCGTPSYVAPEVLADSRTRKYGKEVDIWSLGVVLYICLCGFPPFSDELYSQDFPYTMTQQIRQGRFNYPSPYWDPVGDLALDLIDSMLMVNTEKRFTVEKCLYHLWMLDSSDVSTGKLARPGTSDDEFGEVSGGTHRRITRQRTLLGAEYVDAFRDFDSESMPSKSAVASESIEDAVDNPIDTKPEAQLPRKKKKGTGG